MAKKQKKIRRNVSRGIAHIKASFNNTLITITDENGETLCAEAEGVFIRPGSPAGTPG